MISKNIKEIFSEILSNLQVFTTLDRPCRYKIFHLYSDAHPQTIHPLVFTAPFLMQARHNWKHRFT